MITASRRAVATLLIASLMVAPLRAQSPEGKWENLKLIKQDQEIEIVTNDAKAFRGTLRGLTADSITVRLVSGDQVFQRPDILRIAYKPSGHRSHHIRVGSAIGAGVGVLSGVFSDRCSPHGCTSAGVAIFRSIAVAGLIGAAIGAALPVGGWEVVYRSP